MTALFVALVFACGATFGAGSVVAVQDWRDWLCRRAARKVALRDARDAAAFGYDRRAE